MVENMIMSEEEIESLSSVELVKRADSLFEECLSFIPGISSYHLNEDNVLKLVCSLYRRAMDKGLSADDEVGSCLEGNLRTLRQKLEEAEMFIEAPGEEGPITEYSMPGGEYLRQMEEIAMPVMSLSALTGQWFNPNMVTEPKEAARKVIDLGREAIKAGLPEEGRWLLDLCVEEVIRDLPYEERGGILEEFGIETRTGYSKPKGIQGAPSNRWLWNDF